MAQFQVGKQMIQEGNDASKYQVGVIYVLEGGDPLTQVLSQTLEFSETAEFVAPKEREAEDSVEFTDEAVGVSFTKNVVDTVSFSDLTQSTSPQPFEEDVEQSVIFAQEGRVSTVELEEIHTVLFTQTALKVKIVDGIDRSETQEVLFSDTAGSVFISVDAIAGDAEDDLIFTQVVATPLEKATFSNVVFTQTATEERTKFIESTVEFNHTVDLAISISREVESDLEFTQHFAYELGEPELCFYQPFIGTGTFPAAPTLVKQSFVTLFYPPVSPTLTVQIRAPEFGDRDRLLHDKINRDTRGGSLKIFADTTWPKLQILEMQFTGLKETEAQAILDFFEDTLGLEVGFTDWEGRTWHGVIVSPDRELVRTKRNNVDISFEFEGELQ